jgi:hypothetical protein
MAKRDQDPLPIFKIGGIVRLNEIDLSGWLDRQRSQSMAGGAVPVDQGARLKLIA